MSRHQPDVKDFYLERALKEIRVQTRQVARGQLVLALEIRRGRVVRRLIHRRDTVEEQECDRLMRQMPCGAKGR